MNKKNSFAVLD